MFVLSFNEQKLSQKLRVIIYKLSCLERWKVRGLIQKIENNPTIKRVNKNKEQEKVGGEGKEVIKSTTTVLGRRFRTQLLLTLVPVRLWDTPVFEL